ncbi:MAG: Do family serine endopeptidase [Bryobacteraceae bacterium]
MKLLDRMSQQKLLSMTLLVFTLSVGIVIGTLVNTGVYAAKGQSSAPDATPLVVPPVSEIGNEFTKLAKKLDPSVVNITAETSAKTVEQSRGRRRPQADDEEEPGDGNAPLDLFRFFRNNPGQQMPQRAFKREQSGSGFIVDRNGYIITNNHVVDGVDKIKVKIHGDPAEYKARLIGVDPETDLAVIKIDTKKLLVPVTIANSDSVQVGDWAVAIGSPFGLEASVTAGIVSATGRDINAQQFQRFIQTDAAINPGNSGGPLLNLRGEVIGVNTMIATQSGGYQGIGFALPINTTVKVYNDIVRNGRVTRGSIGISWQKNQKAENLKGLGVNGGVLINEIKKGGPAEKAGLKEEDIIVALNGKSITDGDDLVARIADLPIGTVAKVTADRFKKKMDFNVTIADRVDVFKDDPRVTGGRTPKEEEPAAPEATQAKFGIRIQPLKDSEVDLTPDKHGVAVRGVEPGSFAEDIGMLENDIIISINRQPVSSLDDVRGIQASLKTGDTVYFRIVRQFPGAAGRTGQQVRPQTTTLYLQGTLTN